MTTLAAEKPWPIELRLKRREAVLRTAFDDGSSYDLPAEYLRVRTPSAADRGHGGGPGRCVDGKRGVTIAGLEPVGRYAVRIRFDDGHDTGLYSWTYLYELGRDHESRWDKYLASLAAAGRVR